MSWSTSKTNYFEDEDDYDYYDDDDSDEDDDDDDANRIGRSANNTAIVWVSPVEN